MNVERRGRHWLLTALDVLCVALAWAVLAYVMFVLGAANLGLAIIPPVFGYEDFVSESGLDPAAVPLACLVVTVCWALVGITQRPDRGSRWSPRHLLTTCVMVGWWLVGCAMINGAPTMGKSCVGAPVCELTPVPVVMAVMGIPVHVAALAGLAVARARPDVRRWTSCLPGMVLTIGVAVQHALWRPDFFVA